MSKRIDFNGDDWLPEDDEEEIEGSFSEDYDNAYEDEYADYEGESTESWR